MCIRDSARSTRRVALPLELADDLAEHFVVHRATRRLLAGVASLGDVALPHVAYGVLRRHAPVEHGVRATDRARAVLAPRLREWRGAPVRIAQSGRCRRDLGHSDRPVMAESCKVASLTQWTSTVLPASMAVFTCAAP
eukprot:4347695-Prymnesium_polylepis.2